MCNGPVTSTNAAADIPEGDCDCTGNQLDALGVCGGTCSADVDGDGVCDDVDGCIGEFDTCGVCQWPGDVYECGCADIPDGTATAMETNWMPSVCAEGLAPQMWTAMACATTWTVASENSTPVASAMGRATSTTAGVLASRTGPATATATGWTPSANVEAHAKPTRTETGVRRRGRLRWNVGRLRRVQRTGGGLRMRLCACGPWACDCEGNVYDVCGECGGAGTLGCLDEDACNYNGDACGNDGSCVYAMPGLDCDGNVLVVEGCTDGMAPNFNPAANVDDGSCMEGGCILPSACNYDEDADYYVAGACEFDSCVGCTDEAACNFDPEATLGSLAMCIYPLVFYLGCDGACLNDLDDDGICDELEIPGCTNLEAPNFNPYATDDNGSCLPPLVGGCILPFACNYDPGANFYVPGSCDFECLYGSSGQTFAPCRRHALRRGRAVRILELFGPGMHARSGMQLQSRRDGARRLLRVHLCGGCMNPSPATTKLPPPSTQAAWITPHASGAWIRTQATTTQRDDIRLVFACGMHGA